MFVKAACFSVAALVILEFGIEQKEKKKCGAAVWSVCLIYMRNKKAYQFLSHSHPFTRPASTTLLMIPMHYSKNSLDVCILEKKKEREKYSCEHTFNPLVMSVNINKKEKKKMS